MSDITFYDRRLFWLLGLLCLFTSCHSMQGQSSRALELQELKGKTERPKGACGSIDIRNHVHNLDRITNCTVIEGSLHILLIDYATSDQFQSWSFPDLVEITDHLLLYRITGMKTLRNLFPNLAVIRGQDLFNDFSLVVYEMPDLVELGLVSLTSIPRGAVRLEKNPHLCYIETIDWERIVTGAGSSEDNFIKDNKVIKECVNRCPKTCDSTEGFAGPTQRCWTLYDCQKMISCPETCKTGFCNGTQCCNSNCIGGCSGPQASQCHVCKDVETVDSNNIPRCAERCSPGQFKYKERRCLVKDDCINFKNYTLNFQLKLVVPDKVEEPGLCVSKCPSKYKDSAIDTSKCIPCQGKCPRICMAKIVDSITSAQDLKGCTVIHGPLIINLMGGRQVGKELEDSLSEIEEVKDYIRVYHSYALLSLHFLKNIKIIRGNRLYQQRFSLVVFDNLNLQELFLDNVATNLTLINGSVLFQHNRKLCYKKIDTFVKQIGLDASKIGLDDISTETNGDQMPCDIHKLRFAMLKVTPHIAIFEWSKFKMADTRHLISYSINYKEAPMKNVSIYQGRDACTEDIWKTKDVEIEMDTPDVIRDFITQLKPWTQYAAYVETITISRAVQGAISDIIFFRTAAEVPTSPTNLMVQARVKGELFVTWDPPNQPNGNVTHYEIYWQLRDLEPSEYELRDYCEHTLTSSLQQQERENEEEEKANQTLSDTCCACPKSEKQLRKEERERNMEILFQDFLQNEVYIKRLDRPANTIPPNTKQPTKKKAVPNRRKRDTENYTPDPHETIKYTDPSPVNKTSLTVTLPADPNATTPNTTVVPKKKINTYYKAYVYELLEMTIPNLGHFQDYNIEVIACQERDPRDDHKALLCSNRALGLGRTLPNHSKDTINTTLILVKAIQNKTGAVRITWEDPVSPNGLILTYDIEYTKSNINNVKPIMICITYKTYRDVFSGGYVLDKLEHGNYTFRIRATSLAGNGSWTEKIPFTVPNLEKPPWPKETVIGVVIASLFVIIIITVIIVWVLAKKRFGRKNVDHITSPNPDYMTDYSVYEPDEWEVDRDNVQLIKELGQGSFGMVYEGKVCKLVPGVEWFPIAVKTTNNASNDHDRYMFLQEASIMKAFRCHHVVKLMGVVSRGQPAFVLMELMLNGDLKNYLRMHRPDEEDNDGRSPPTLKQILQIAGEVVDGMAYLADKKYVHRDLAARNCMVGEDMTVKIGDFGMTRDIYETDYYRKGNRGLLPVRWMAPESLKDGVFTSGSDVWSFGVVLWEMATLAAQPYQGLSNEEVLKYVGSGKIMDTPERCPPKLYDLMVKCWRYRPKQRPTFKEIIEILLPDLDKKFMECSYFFSEENAKYEEAKQLQAANNHLDDRDRLDNIDVDDDDDDDDDHAHCPMNDYVDEANLPMLGSGASNGHSVELQDIFTDNGSYPHYSNAHKHVGSAEVCDCTAYREVDEGAAAQSEFHRTSVCSSPNSAIGGSSDGSKDSSKSSSSSYAHMNGLSVANGHVPVHVRTTPC